jgi:hypothetical protein
VEHTRTITVKLDGIEISDMLSGTGSVSISLYFHFDQGFELVPTGNGIMARSISHNITVNAGTDDGEALIARIETFELSPEYGVAVIAPKIIFDRNITLPCVISTIFKV